MRKNITIKFDNGNKVKIFQRWEDEFSLELNGNIREILIRKTEDMIIILNDLRKITCKIDSWDAIL